MIKCCLIDRTMSTIRSDGGCRSYCKQFDHSWRINGRSEYWKVIVQMGLCCGEHTLLDGFGTILQLGVVSALAPMPKSPFASEDSNKTKGPKKLRKERKEVWKKKKSNRMKKY